MADSKVDASRGCIVRHYLYFPSLDAAAEVADSLTMRGFSAESRLGADGENWLVLATHFAQSENAIAAASAMLEASVLPYSGEYDGYEVEIVDALGRV